MSDGLSDANAWAELQLDLEIAAGNLRKAIIDVRDGHRGISIDVLAVANQELRGCGYEIKRKKP